MVRVEPGARDNGSSPVDTTRPDSTAAAIDPALARTAASGDGVPPSTDALIGTSIGRYRVLDRLGAGGMGVVYRALDPALDRTVALKVLPPLDEVRRGQLEERLRREAQALARLDHENVLAVYDVGIANANLFVAMQFVDGTTLDDHLAAHRLAPRKLLALFVAAGRGLAAAHVAGIIHRDVKPSNLLVDRQGRVYVGDFGLARGAAEVESPSGSEDDLLVSNMTRVGAVIGTPLFMAPEQLRGEPATERADQFSFCVSLWFELFGRHPFVGGAWTRDVALTAMEADRIVEPQRVAGVPARVLRALRRGLRHDPQARWRDMTALLAELEPRSRMPWVLGGLTAAGLVGGAVVASVVGGAMTSSDPCENASARLDAVVTTERITALPTEFAATGLPYAADTAKRTVAAIGGYARSWSAQRLAACRANKVRHDESDELFDRRIACLDHGMLALDSALVVLTTKPSHSTVDHSIELVAGLPPVSDCADASRLAAATSQPADHTQRLAIDQLAVDLERFGAELAAGISTDAVGRSDALVARARSIGWAPLVGRALHVAADARHVIGHTAEAISQMREAAVEAGRARDDLSAAGTLTTLAHWLADAGRPAEALVVADDAEILVLHAGDPGRIRAQLLSARAVAQGELSRFAEAEAAFEKAITIARGDPAHDELVVAQMLRDEAAVLRTASKRDRARALMTEAQQILVSRLGPLHPRVAEVHIDFAALDLQLRDLAAAREELARARAIAAPLAAESPALAAIDGAEAQIALREGRVADAMKGYQAAYAFLQRVAPDHPDTTRVLYMMASVLQQQGHYDEALVAFQKVVDNRVRMFGEDSVTVADALDGVSNSYQGRDDLAHALEARTRSLAVREKALGPDNPDVALSLQGLAYIALDQGKCDDAIRASQRALAIFDKAGSPDKLRVDSLDAIGTCQMRSGQLSDAREALEKSLALADTPGGGSIDQRATARIDLGELLWQLKDHARARKLVQEAAEIYRGVGRTDELPELESWLAKHAR